MRRLIAYITLAVSTFIAIGVGINPTLTKGSQNLDYRDGKQFVYQLFDKEDVDLEIEDEKASLKVAQIMDERLKGWGVSNYQIEAEGSDLVRVSLTAKNDTEYNYLENYLGFSGGDFSISTQDHSVHLMHEDVFEDSEARIVYEGIAPYVIIPLSDPSAFKTLVDAANSALDVDKDVDIDPDADILTRHSLPKKANGEPEEDSGSKANIFLWANWQEGEDYDKAQEDPKIARRIIASFNSKNIYYENSEVKDSEIKFLSGFADEEGNYDTSKIKQANNLANYVKSLFNAGAYEYEVLNIITTPISANVESLLNYGATINLATSKTLIATLIAFVVLSLVLVFFYRLASLAVITSIGITFFASLGIFILFMAEFNIAALLALILIVASSLLSGILQINKFKEEVYRGRNYKKAQTESSKAMVLFNVDLALVSVFVGVLSYLISGALVKSFATMLVIGGVVGLVINLIVLRVMMWLVTNTTSLQDNHKVFNIEAKHVPNLLKEEKQTYFGPYQEKDFTKKAKPIAIGAGVVGLVSVIMMLIFGLVNGSIFNQKNTYQEVQRAYITITSDSPVIESTKYLEDEILQFVVVDGEVLKYDSIDHESREDYDAETTITTKYNYYIINFSKHYDVEAHAEIVIGSVLIDSDTFEVLLNNYINSLEGGEAGVSIKLSQNVVTQPSTLYIVLGTLAGVAAATIYLAFRYRLSRALGAFSISALSSLLTLGFFVITRISLTPIISLVVPLVAVLSLFMSLLYFDKEKILIKEDRSRRLSQEIRQEIMLRSVALSAGPLFIYAIMMSYLAINYFGFGPFTFGVIFAGNLLGVALNTLLVVTLLGPSSMMFEKGLTALKDKISLPEREKTKKRTPRKTTSGEPEETIFIGIND